MAHIHDADGATNTRMISGLIQERFIFVYHELCKTFSRAGSKMSKMCRPRRKVCFFASLQSRRRLCTIWKDFHPYRHSLSTLRQNLYLSEHFSFQTPTSVWKQCFETAMISFESYVGKVIWWGWEVIPLRKQFALADSSTPCLGLQ